jgi:hypothetical protein
MHEAEIEDNTSFDKYITSLYWATVTSITVGYGDITPTNSYEVEFTCIILVIGVSIFSYTLSALATNFNNLLSSSSIGAVTFILF